MKTVYVIGAGLAVAGALSAIEKFCRHPTYGQGLNAALAAGNAALALGPASA